MQTTKGIVLRVIRYSDSRIIVTIFTEHYGMLSAGVRLVRGGRSGGRSALWQVLNVVEMSVDYRPANELQKISDVSIAVPWMELPYNPVKASISMFLGDFLYHSLRGEGENPALFSFLYNSLHWLDEADGNVANFHLLLMIRMTRFLGIWPSMAGYGRNMVYDMKNACFASVLPVHGQYLEAKYARWIPLLLEMDYSRMHRLRMTREERWHMLEVLLQYYHLHVPSFGELQSVEILRELFS